MKLYVFDSCPYCIRVRALIGIKNIPCEIVPIVLGEWPEHVTAQVDATTVPMLEVIESSSGQSTFMRESSDILAFLDKTTSEVLLDGYQLSGDLKEWLATIKADASQLSYPRMRKLNLPELSAEDAMARFEQMIGVKLGQSLDDALINTIHYLPTVSGSLQQLDTLLDIHSLLKQERKVNMDDICVFAELRNLMMVAELAFPEIILQFMRFMSMHTKISLYKTVNATGSLSTR